MKILIVDDERAAAEDLATVLKTVVPHAETDQANSAMDAEALLRKRTYDVAFLDIEMPVKNGMNLARELIERYPKMNLVMLTAYPEYALEAHHIFVSGYLLKPAMEEDVRAVFAHLRNPVPDHESGLYVRCFGNFEVFYNGKIVSFKRNKAKEMLAYLIDRRGSSATNMELRNVLFGDDGRDAHKVRDHFHHIAADLRETLKSIGCEDVLAWEHNSYAVRPDMIPCDLFRALSLDPLSIPKFGAEYMSQYPWARDHIALLMESLDKE